MGLAAAWRLASRGASVLLLERFAFGHARGASHGATRNLNDAYADDAHLDLYDRSVALYRELEERGGRRLLARQGLVTHGDPTRVGERYAALRERGAAVEMLSASDAEARWPGMRFGGDAMLSRDAGRIDAEGVFEVLAAQARAHGAELRANARVTRILEEPDGVTVTVVDGEGRERTVVADGAVVASGAWTASLVGELVDLPRLVVTEEHPAHFSPLPAFAGAEWPSFNQLIAPAGARGAGDVYGMFAPGEGVKVGFHRTGPGVDPDRRAFRASAEARDALRRHVSEWFPGLDAASAVEISCTYTTAVHGRFVLDRRGRIAIGAGFAGEGFKFAPAVGDVLADLSLGARPGPEAFALPG